MHNREKILGAATFLFLAGCAARSAAPGDFGGTAHVTQAVPQEPVTLKRATGGIIAMVTAGEAGADDSWFGPDKIKHFFIAGFIESLTFGGLLASGAGHSAALAGAVATTAAFALAREFYDKRTKGIFSIPDLAWDAAGAGAAALVLRATQQ